MRNDECIFSFWTDEQKGCQTVWMGGAILCTDTSSLQTDAKTVRTDVAILWKDANVFQTDFQTI